MKNEASLTSNRLCGLGFLSLLLAASPAISQERVNESALALKEFADAVRKYAELHHRLEAELPRLPQKAEASQIAAHRMALAQKIRAARKGAERKDIFTSEVKEALLPAIRALFEGAHGALARQTVKEGNPAVEGKTHDAAPLKIKLYANAFYPQGAPFSSVPAALLSSLPPLPPELEYRFVGRHLILLDIEADLIVDFLKNAVPDPN